MQPWQYKPARDLDLRGSRRWTSVRREAGLDERLTQSIWWMGVRLGLSFMHRLRVGGIEHLPQQPPFVVIANHCSHLDAPVIIAALPAHLRRTTMALAAGDTFFDNRPRALFSAMCLNALPMWRKNVGRHAINELRRRLIEEPCSYVVFPEGTRSRDGEMNAFKPGLGMLIAGTDVPVVPCCIRGAFDAWPPHAARPRPLPVSLHFGPAMRFAEQANCRSGWKQIAKRCETAVRQLAGVTSPSRFHCR